MEDKDDDDGEQGWIHGKTVADGQAGAILRKTLIIQRYLGPTNGRTDTAMLSVSATKKNERKEMNDDEEGKEDDNEGKEQQRRRKGTITKEWNNDDEGKEQRR